MEIDEDDSISVCIPTEIYSTLPHQSVSIHDFIHFRLPPASQHQLTFANADEFFNNCPPNTDNEDILELAVPPIACVKELERVLPSAVRMGRQSVKCPHVTSNTPKTYPLWIVPLWATISHIRDVQKLWTTAKDSLLMLRKGWENKADVESVKVVDDILAALATLPWDQNLQGFGRNATEKIHKLVSYTSNDWLNGDHANQMLELLKMDIERNQVPSTEVASTYFYEKISDGFKQQNQYTSDPSFRVYRQMGHRLATGASHRVAFLANLHRNHWVAVVLDFRENVIWYGDSLGYRIPAGVKEIIEWWIRFHSGDEFSYQQLPITTQHDYFSCCLLAWNALAAFFFRDQEGLISASDVALGRLQVLLRLIRKHQSETVHPENPGDVIEMKNRKDDGYDFGKKSTNGIFPRLTTEALRLRLERSEKCFKDAVTTMEVTFMEQITAKLTIARLEVELGSLKRSILSNMSSGKAARVNLTKSSNNTLKMMELKKHIQILEKAKAEGDKQLADKTEESNKKSAYILELEAQLDVVLTQISPNCERLSRQLWLALQGEPETTFTAKVREVQQNLARLSHVCHPTK